jgi:cytochrome c biogenesis protein CcmG, thiol:disulfide interchange protein DsbE
MRRALIPLLVFAFLVALMIVGLKHAPEKEIVASPLISRPAPPFHAPRLTDPSQFVTEQSLQGQWRLLNVWGTWCGGCREEHAALLAIRKEGRVPIIGLDWKDNDADAIAWLARLGNPYHEVATDHDGRIAIDYGVYGAPETFLINPAGIVVEKQVGIMTAEVWRDKFLRHLDAAAGGRS